MVRIAALSDIHGNLPALEAVRRAVHAARPDYVAICGDLVFNGPDPVGTLALVRELEQAGAHVIARQHGPGRRRRRLHGRVSRGSPKEHRTPTRPRPSGPATRSATTAWTTCAACRGSDGCGSDDDLVLFCHALARFADGRLPGRPRSGRDDRSRQPH